MLGSEWLYGAIALLVGVHILTMLYAYRRQGEPTSGAAQSDPEATMPVTSDEEAGTVTCAHCGARNQQGYQFCRECIADMSSGTPHRPSQERPNGY
ncbi:zinc ribbon domain-containing protein [Haloarcula sp. S1CR25-12]|uniref:Zinc ribbon domain-containing protein n=1 Tax=Haloarcula saliterrae TaxID=2950534 RepID=A0ABU2FGE2_9EURY|nr:zinc ribbon domain-containing protein [Haloarcula sp. S1CR25-12]MDS0260780.1 zinc ribbon domain-containing protein [Haloarcula sp. S1CR25-12]